MSEIREALYNAQTRTWVTGDVLAVRGWPDCRNVMCTRMNGECINWHCPACGKPTDAQGGHRCGKDGEAR